MREDNLETICGLWLPDENPLRLMNHLVIRAMNAAARIHETTVLIIGEANSHRIWALGVRFFALDTPSETFAITAFTVWIMACFAGISSRSTRDVITFKTRSEIVAKLAVRRANNTAITWLDNTIAIFAEIARIGAHP